MAATAAYRSRLQTRLLRDLPPCSCPSPVATNLSVAERKSALSSLLPRRGFVGLLRSLRRAVGAAYASNK